ncbi:hypothetical protein C5167_035495 [Papaver somniferum]|uniref:Clathrin/coatomer adaptor adaptin-like N-terminal domain-containing protein n=1 Tax=Papaver somniferum TaxID=3469 RepID=A0A4Y7KK90_PAPSO|nr:hypothetical protein C5167_035495 [Papaver somniferum]
MFVQVIHSCAIKFPEVASTVVHLLRDFLGDSNVASAIDVVVFAREVIETNPKLRALASPNLDVRRKTTDISLELITPRNIDEVVQALKKEVVKSQSTKLEKNGEYCQMLVQAIHFCAIKFPEVASTVVHLLMDFLGDSNVASAIDVVVFAREVIETNPKLRVAIITRLLDTFCQIRAARVCSFAL